MEQLPEDIVRHIENVISQMQARLELLQAEVDKLHKSVSMLEKRVDELELDQEESAEDIAIVEESEVDRSLLDHLLGEKSHDINPKSATHLSLTVDLSKSKKDQPH